MHSLCNVLNQASSYVHKWLIKQPSVKEESLTDWMLYDISVKSPKIYYQTFSRHEEGRTTGADWEWWFVSNSQSLKLRVQAKKAQGSTNIYSELARSNQHGLQIDKLLSDAAKQNAIPLYAFFSSENVPTLCHLVGKPTEGVYLASATRVYDEFIAVVGKKVLAKNVLAISNPLSCITCCPLSQPDGLPLKYFRTYFPEEFQQSESGNTVGVHEQIPPYVQALLSHDRLGSEESMGLLKIPRDFEALLVFDMRSCAKVKTES